MSDTYVPVCSTRKNDSRSRADLADQWRKLAEESEGKTSY